MVKDYSRGCGTIKEWNVPQKQCVYKEKIMKRIISLLLAVCCVFVLCACGSSAKEAEYRIESPAAAASYAYDYNDAAVAMEEYGGFSAKSEEAAADYVPSPAVSGNGVAEGTDAPSENPEKKIYSADATVETTQFDATIAALEKMIESKGGFVESSSVNSSNYTSISKGNPGKKNAYYTIRIPAGKFAETMNSLSVLGNVPHSYTYTENVTSQYYDTAARLKTYKAQEERLTELLDKAETVADVIEIENELSEVRYRIESLQTTLNGWDRRVSYSTINLEIIEVSEYTPEEKVGYGKRLKEAFADGFDGFKEFILIIAEALPILIFAAIVITGIVHVARKNAEKRKARKIARAEKKAKKKEESGEKKEEKSDE